MDVVPTFSLGVTQDIQPHILDTTTEAANNPQSNDIEEDLLVETDAMNELGSSSKSPCPKSHAIKKKKVEPITNRPSLPKGLSYVVKQIPKHSLKFGASYNSTYVDVIRLSIGDEGLERFRQTIFGPYLRIPQCNFQGQIVKCLMLLELKQNKTDELHIRHSKGNILRFTLRDFAIITGLKCSGKAEEFRYSDSTTSSLIQKYFPGPRPVVSKGRLVQRFLMGGWDNTQEAVQMATFL